MSENELPDPMHLVRQLRRGDIEVFTTVQFSESYLKNLAEAARQEQYFDVIVAELISRLTVRPSREFDWNVGSLLQHADAEWVFANISKSETNRESLYESIGLTWCLGEFGRRDPIAVTFLEDAVARARSSASWFRAAQSLENLGIVDAISYLKASLRSQESPQLETCLADLSDYRNRIGILLHSTVDNLHNKILPRIKQVLCDTSSDKFQRLGAAWLVGRFRYLDKDIQVALSSLVSTERYEVRFYAIQAIRDIASVRFLSLLIDLLCDDDPLLRKISAQGLGSFNSPDVVIALESALFTEQHPDVIGAITQALYDNSHHAHRRDRDLRRRIGANENGMIADEGDKWYVNPDIYHIFSQSQDPENLVFRTALKGIEATSTNNPIDIGSGTGRFAGFLLDQFPFEGTLSCVDASPQMTRFLNARFRRESISSSVVNVVECRTEKIVEKLGENVSDLVVASFAFPSRIFDTDLVLRELQAVFKLLRPGGHLVTVGWDETFNDELSEMWYKYIPDGIRSRNFEEWRKNRAVSIKSTRNSNLSWYKRGIKVPLEFDNAETAARVMGYLFGRSAAEEIIRTRQIRWSISAGITINSKESIGNILYENGMR